MNASDKKKAVEKAILEVAEADDLQEIERIEKRAYEYARGSNERKELLWAAVAEAKKRIS